MYIYQLYMCMSSTGWGYRLRFYDYDYIYQLTMDNKKIREENSRLRRSKGSVLDDDSVLDSIEASFKQFHEFLDLLRDAGWVHKI